MQGSGTVQASAPFCFQPLLLFRAIMYRRNSVHRRRASTETDMGSMAPPYLPQEQLNTPDTGPLVWSPQPSSPWSSQHQHQQHQQQQVLDRMEFEQFKSHVYERLDEQWLMLRQIMQCVQGTNSQLGHIGAMTAKVHHRMCYSQQEATWRLSAHRSGKGQSHAASCSSTAGSAVAADEGSSDHGYCTAQKRQQQIPLRFNPQQAESAPVRDRKADAATIALRVSRPLSPNAHNRDGNQASGSGSSRGAKKKGAGALAIRGLIHQQHQQQQLSPPHSEPDPSADTSSSHSDAAAANKDAAMAEPATASVVNPAATTNISDTCASPLLDTAESPPQGGKFGALPPVSLGVAEMWERCVTTHAALSAEIERARETGDGATQRLLSGIDTLLAQAPSCEKLAQIAAANACDVEGSPDRLDQPAAAIKPASDECGRLQKRAAPITAISTAAAPAPQQQRHAAGAARTIANPGKFKENTQADSAASGPARPAAAAALEKGPGFCPACTSLKAGRAREAPCEEAKGHPGRSAARPLVQGKSSVLELAKMFDSSTAAVVPLAA
ncbi:hypothetical protein GQ54DRAFT_121828 [Martensiomyces pterosporus]|nr:hypothetical protein GQ54DRAFT_121828 [Martensiomyces pterosporus]